MSFKSIVIFCTVLLLGACTTLSHQFSEEKLNHIGQQGLILDAKTQQALSNKELINQLSPAQIVIIGEKHDVLAHHHAQQWLIQALAKERQQGSVVMEMLQTSQQDALTKVQQQFNNNLALKANKVRKAISWQKGWDWSAYGGLVMQILQQGTLLLSGNLDFSTIKQIYKEQAVLEGKHSNQPYVNDTLADTIIKSHENANVPAMLAVQKHRDREMAKQLSKAAKPTMLIAGNFHARKDVGVPLHLQDINPQLAAQTKVILLLTKNQDFDGKQADFIWLLD